MKPTSVILVLWVGILMMPRFGSGNTVDPARFEDQSVISLAAGTLVLVREEVTLWRHNLSDWPEAILEKTEIRPISDRTEAAILSLTSNGQRYRVALVRHNAGRPRIVWQGRVSLQGDPGERLGEDVRLVPTPDSPIWSLWKGQISENIVLCGQQETPLLFARQYRSSTGRFQRESRRVEVSEATVLLGTASTFFEQSDFFRFVVPTAVSAVSGDRETALLLTPPFSLVDGIHGYGWSPGSGREAGEFVTFSTVSEQLEIRRIHFSVPSVQDRNHAPPETLWLMTPDAVFQLRFPPGETRVAFVFPQPLSIRCFSLMMADSADPRNRPISLFEVQADVFLTMDQAVSLLNDPVLGEQAVLLLRTSGNEVLAEIQRQWEKLSPRGRHRALRIVLDRNPQESLDLLSRISLAPDAEMSQKALVGLVRAGAAGARSLSDRIDWVDREIALRGVRLLRRFKDSDACPILLDRVGKGDAELRRQTVEAVRACMTVQMLPDLLSFAKEAWTRNEMRVALDLLRIGVGVSDVDEAAVSFVVDIFETITDFENRYRALRVLSKSGADRALPLLVKMSADADPHLRELAVSGLQTHENTPSVRERIPVLLSDPEPAVRIAAISLLNRLSIQEATDWIDILLTDPWPQVRIPAIDAASKLPEEGRRRILLQALSDQSTRVVLAALRLAGEMSVDEDVSARIRTKLSLSEPNREIRKTAAATAARRCQMDSATVTALGTLLAHGADRMADPADTAVASVAAMALGRIETEDAVRWLKRVRVRGNLTTDRAIDAALSNASMSCQASSR